MNEILERGTEIQVDMRDIADFHHREHHMDWITVQEVISGSWGYRYKCTCRDGFTIWAEPENVRRTR